MKHSADKLGGVCHVAEADRAVAKRTPMHREEIREEIAAPTPSLQRATTGGAKDAAGVMTIYSLRMRCFSCLFVFFTDIILVECFCCPLRRVCGGCIPRKNTWQRICVFVERPSEYSGGLRYSKFVQHCNRCMQYTRWSAALP